MLVKTKPSKLQLLVNTLKSKIQNKFKQQGRGIKYPLLHYEVAGSQEQINCADYPLLNMAEVHWGNKGLCRFNLNVNEQTCPYLRQHRFPLGDLMPATAILEYFVEAATWLQHRGQGTLYWSPLQVYGLKLDRILPLPAGNESVQLEIEVLSRLLGPKGHEIQLQLLTPRYNKQGVSLGMKRHASVTIAFDPLLTANKGAPLLFGEVTHYQANPAELYSKVFTTHGPLLQSLTGDMAINHTRQQILAQYDCQQKERAWLEPAGHRFLLSPLGLDSCLQLLCFLAILQDGQPRLPVAIDKLLLYRLHPEQGRCRALIELTKQGHGQTCARISVFNSCNERILDIEQAIAQSQSGNDFDLALFNLWLRQCEITKETLYEI
ncbi:polyketide synthase dehydratase domain-containing protein [Motilimonas eburnea]|uniref:polyketide synthase dehydratase domain-containing protein n=1 Tax=Motilimonas eburnea TaxID=1737488 RepID=UPI001E304B58|nr:polyketide synthase dehydratase domain-containing protein [Motilimonas eburnea]MCE2570356.1 polyketide synthase dehydratase domain-containing protein [Motilimonas eburnea]